MHRARALVASEVACKLQYPDMQSAVEADLNQLQLLFAIRKRFDPVIDTSEIAVEIGARLREELDYVREAKHVALYQHMLKDEESIRVPKVWPNLSTGRLLTLDWLSGRKLLEHKDDTLAARNRLQRRCSPPGGFPSVASASSTVTRILAITRSSMMPKESRAGINLMDYGCIRIFPPSFVGGVVDLYRGLLRGDDGLVVHAYETWGFKRLNRELIDALNIWARFIYGPLLDNRVRTIADGVKPSDYGRKEAFRVHQALKARGPVTVPREFVFMDRAAIGLGAVFLHLAAELNFYRLFNEAIEAFAVKDGRVAARRRAGRWDSNGARLVKDVNVMAGLMPAIHVFDIATEAWMPPHSAGLTAQVQTWTAQRCPSAAIALTPQRLPFLSDPENRPMADHGTVEYATATGNDYAAHEQSYESFVHFTLVGILYVVTIMFGLATGGVMGHWLLAATIFVIGLLGAIPACSAGRRPPAMSPL